MVQYRSQTSSRLKKIIKKIHSETELTVGVLKRERDGERERERERKGEIKNAQKVKQNAFSLDEARQNATFQGTPLPKATNFTKIE